MDDLTRILSAVDNDGGERPPFENELLDSLLIQLETDRATDTNRLEAVDNALTEVVVVDIETSNPGRGQWLFAAAAVILAVALALASIRPATEVDTTTVASSVDDSPVATTPPAQSIDEACSRFVLSLAPISSVNPADLTSSDLVIWLDGFDQLDADLDRLGEQERLIGMQGDEIRGRINQARAQSVQGLNAGDIIATALSEWGRITVGDLEDCRIR